MKTQSWITKVLKVKLNYDIKKDNRLKIEYWKTPVNNGLLIFQRLESHIFRKINETFRNQGYELLIFWWLSILIENEYKRLCVLLKLNQYYGMYWEKQNCEQIWLLSSSTLIKKFAGSLHSLFLFVLFLVFIVKINEIFFSFRSIFLTDVSVNVIFKFYIIL